MNEQSESMIKSSADQNLLLNLSKLFESERKTTRFVLLHLLEVESRKLYAKRGFDSLFRMLVVDFKQSETSANRRLQAMRILRDVPVAQECIVSGKVNLTTLSMAQSQIRKQEKFTGHKVSAAKKAEIVENIKNKTQAEAETELFKLLPEIASSPKTHEKRISESATRLGLNFPDEVLNKLKRLREIWSHVDPGMDYVEIINRCADETLKRVDPRLKKARKSKLMKQGANPSAEAGGRAVVKSNLKQCATGGACLKSPSTSGFTASFQLYGFSMITPHLRLVR
jgi:hypothetical protein